MNVAVPAALLLLAVCCGAVYTDHPRNATISRALCEGGVCHVSSGDFWQLQDIVSSNRIVVLDSEVLRVENKPGFLVIENVRNFTISGREIGGSVIKCTSESTFALRLRNVTNVTLARLKIINCGSIIPRHLALHMYTSWDQTCDLVSCPGFSTDTQTSLLIETSTKVLLSGVEILRSPGIALSMLGIITHDFFPFFEVNVRMIDCSISQSRAGSLVIRGNGSLSVEDTIIADSSTGLVSTSANVMMKNSELFNCTSSFMDEGFLIVRETLTMNGSALNIRGKNSNIILYSSNNLLFAATVVDSELFITAGSMVVFTNFNLTSPSSALLLQSASLRLEDNSSLIFTRNTASNGSSILAVISGQVAMTGESSLVCTHNSLREGWIVLSAFKSQWTTKDDSVIDISNNTAFDNATMVAFHDSEWDVLDSATVSFRGNFLFNWSIAAHSNGGSINFHNNSLLAVLDNSAAVSSYILVMVGPGDVRFGENVNVAVVNNSARQESHIVSMPADKSVGSVGKLSFYQQLSQAGLEKRSIQPTITPDLPASGFGLVPTIYDEFPQPAPGDDLIGIIEYAPDGILLPEATPLLTFELGGKLSFRGNSITDRSVGLACISCVLSARGVQLTFEGNDCETSSYIMLLSKATTSWSSGSDVDFKCNKVSRDSSLLLSLSGTLDLASDSSLSVTENTVFDGFSILFSSTNVSLRGPVRIANNSLSDFGALNVFSSSVLFQGRLEVVGNRAESGGITADNSQLSFTNRATFSDNEAANGGAVTLISSVMYVSPNATVDFARNSAQGLGGAIFISKPRQKYVCDALTATAASCSIRSLSDSGCQMFSLTFSQNRAGIAGNAIYGGRTSACIPSDGDAFCSHCPLPNTPDLFQYHGVNDSSDLSSLTSDPTRVCFCEDGVPDCYKVVNTITAHPGAHFDLSLAIVGYGLGTVPGSVVARDNRRGRFSEGKFLFGRELEYSQKIGGTECEELGYSVVSERDGEEIALAVDTRSFVRSREEVEAVLKFQQTRNTNDISPILRSPYDSILEAFFHVPVFVEVSLLPCPVGFQLVAGRCVCHQILQENDVNTCTISNGSGFVLSPAPYWIGLPNDTNASILLHSQCPFDYRQSGDVVITADSIDAQCQFQRSGVLCGSCRKGLSVTLGSSECRACSNVYLMSITIFALVGVALVTVVTVLNMTVSVGTLNGLVLFANILQANQATFLPPATPDTSGVVAFLRVFVAWLNLDLGIPMCFFDGLTTYARTWLQFAFPLYLLAMVGVMIKASSYSARVTLLLGTNTVSVLATLVLLSYTKILRVLITAFSFTTLTGSHGYHSTVWLADGNIEYFEPKHAVLFAVSLLVLLLVGVPYTVTLTAAPWIQRSRFNRVSSLYNRFKPLFDAYMGPYKDSCRYWTGMLLLARVVLIVLFSSISNTNTVAGPSLNLLLLTLSSSALLALTTFLRPYKSKLLNGLEIFHLTILLIFSSSNLYVSSIGTGTGPRVYIYIALVGMSFFVFLGVCVGHVWYRMRTGWTGMKPGPPAEREERRRPQWQRARVRGEEDEERAEVTLSTAGRTTDTSSGGGRERWSTENQFWSSQPSTDTHTAVSLMTEKISGNITC